MLSGTALCGTRHLPGSTSTRRRWSRVVTPGVRGTPQKETHPCGTMTQDLLALADWLTSKGVTHIAMESTGEFWKPVYQILEASCTVWVVNAQHSKTVPGWKTDVKD